MAINRESNAYTIIFAIIMVSVVGGALAFISTSLKPIQKANAKNEKMQNILQAMGDSTFLSITRDEAGDLFNQYVTRRITLSAKGDILSDHGADVAIDEKDPLEAFNIDLRKEYVQVTNLDDRKYPLFIMDVGSTRCFIVSASGKGLWDDIWGYLGIMSNGSEICGAVFDHKGETPGLGSKITEDWFEESFKGKRISENGSFKPIKVQKPGKKLTDFTVDGISGGTFTSAGVTEMLGRTMVVYYNFFTSPVGKEFLK